MFEALIVVGRDMHWTCSQFNPLKIAGMKFKDWKDVLTTKVDKHTSSFFFSSA